ncbi:hypothetical protein DAEQUDRAFT_406272 [Daedalea quercina L-15889]|uniref:Uncharacterized protein n=1 Tax=Daedalea quercina L-15889 TaxID=1314783 RepID=A0A165NN38_9APHY|nr:hypothetical protein DAEQUDRAFT_406272 [Daedalea quercina L-15889]
MPFRGRTTGNARTLSRSSFHRLMTVRNSMGSDPHTEWSNSSPPANKARGGCIQHRSIAQASRSMLHDCVASAVDFYSVARVTSLRDTVFMVYILFRATIQANCLVCGFSPPSVYSLRFCQCLALANLLYTCLQSPGPCLVIPSLVMASSHLKVASYK